MLRCVAALALALAAPALEQAQQGRRAALAVPPTSGGGHHHGTAGTGGKHAARAAARPSSRAGAAPPPPVRAPPPPRRSRAGATGAVRADADGAEAARASRRRSVVGGRAPAVDRPALKPLADALPARRGRAPARSAEDATPEARRPGSQRLRRAPSEQAREPPRASRPAAPDAAPRAPARPPAARRRRPPEALPSCLYPHLPKHAKGRGCCGGCPRCPPVSDPSEPLRILGANHKTGTVLGEKVLGAVREARVAGACLAAASTVRDVHWRGLARCRPEKCGAAFEGRRALVVALVRDPFEMVVSGYLYHLAGKEKWCTLPMNGDAPGHGAVSAGWHRHILAVMGLDAVYASNLTGTNDRESYEQYLGRSTRRDGLVAEFVRASKGDLPGVEASFDDAAAAGERRNASVHCLDDLTAPKLKSRDPFAEAWAAIFDFFEYPAASVGPAVAAARAHDAALDPSATSGHGTSGKGLTAKVRANRTQLFRTAVAVDRDVFGGKYARLSRKLGCPQPSARPR